MQANRTGEATAERRADIERGIQRLPRFLRELKPLMADLGGFAGQAAPVARDLNRSGEDVSRLIQRAGSVLDRVHHRAHQPRATPWRRAGRRCCARAR